MKELLENLIALQTVDPRLTATTVPETDLNTLRAKIPAPILGHYDRLADRGKKGVSFVRNGVCAACHMGLGTGVIATLLHGKDLQLCGSCGRYLYMADEEKQALTAPKVKKPKRTKKPVAHAV